MYCNLRNVLSAIAIMGFALQLQAAGHLDGNWKGNCHTEQNAHMISSSTVNGNNATTTDAVYMDANCSQLAISATASFTYQEGSANVHVPTATDIDSTLSTLTLTPATEQLAGQLNGMNFCGKNDWAANKATDITGLTCNNKQMPKAGDRFYNIYSLSTPEQNTLMMGKITEQFDGTTPEKRPQELDTQNTYKRQ